MVVTGHQRYWEFYYPANNSYYNSSYDEATNTVSGGALWAAPGSVVQINVTGADVVHSFNIPQLGVRIDAIPGRTNSFAFSVPNVSAGTQDPDPVHRVLRRVPRNDAFLPRSHVGPWSPAPPIAGP